MIEVENLVKRYGPTLAVDGISFTVKAGEILGFLGPNGAGKTTTMRMLTGYLPPTEGTAKIMGIDVEEEPLKVKGQIGYMPENVPLYDFMTVRSYLQFMSEIKGIGRKNRKTMIDAALEKCWLTDVQNRIIGNLSRGYKQRVGIAQAILPDPRALILDEPTLGLDPNQIIQVRNMIKGLKENHTVILSSHILPEVSATCDRIIIINKGRLVAQDTPESLARKLQATDKIYLEARGPKDQMRDFLGSQSGVVEVEEKDPGYLIETEAQTDLRPQLSAAVIGRGWDLLELRSVGLSLEEVFLELTTQEKEVLH